MRTESVPCKNATQYEIDNGKHVTWDDESHCTVCRGILDRFSVMHAEAAAEHAALAMWNTGACSKCNGTGDLGQGTDAHPSVYGIQCPDCELEDLLL